MHLTANDCAGSGEGGGGLMSCATKWLFKSTTAFYGAEDWHLPWYFGLLCWSYAVAGLVVLITTKKRPTKGASKATTAQAAERFPRQLYALFLIFIQGMDDVSCRFFREVSNSHNIILLLSGKTISATFLPGRLRAHGSR
jgi:hypothetical protein